MILINDKVCTLAEALDRVRRWFGVESGPVLSSERRQWTTMFRYTRMGNPDR